MSKIALHPDFATIPQQRVTEVRSLLDERVAHPGFDKLAELYCEYSSDVLLPPPGTDTRIRLRAILGFTASHLNLREFQGGVERRMIDWNNLPCLDAADLNTSG